MKRYLNTLFLITLFVLMLAYPGVVFAGAREGLLLWFDTVLPTLFPFMILTGLLTGSSALEAISSLLHPVTGALFRISPASSLAVLAGFFCGYPMGARTSAGLVRNGSISEREGEYLLAFCNNTSPMFVISYVFMQTMQRKDLAFMSLLILLLSPVICSFLFRKYYFGRKTTPAADDMPAGSRKPKSMLQLLDDCIADSCEGIIKIGGYMIVCSIALALLKLIPCKGFFWCCVILPSIEITSGVSMLAKSPLVFPVRYILIMALTSFGGICSVFQTKCMTAGTSFSMARYITEKLITALVTSLLSFFFVKLYR
ncbi:MAG: nucleoside recognition domain-containing protein [Bariatricus sp.]